MCLFPTLNLNTSSVAFRSGVHYFKCGSCPECLREKSSSWALRAVYESRSHAFNCMITLTYDHFKYNSKGDIIGEEDVNPDLLVNKRHIQLFIKRLRKHFNSKNIKYIACAEYGSRTHRAHYHCLLFGVNFSDAVFYKRSKRGNPIYMSKTLTDLWSHGICSIDCKNVQSSVARYCTKYCAKSRSDETFMLFSHEIGLNELLKDFNGRSYYVAGREYVIPRVVWQHYITEKYSNSDLSFSHKYVNRDKAIPFVEDDFKYVNSLALRTNYQFLRNSDPVYNSYLLYWKTKSSLYDSVRPSVIKRIYALDESKFHFYKVSALRCYSKRFSDFVPYPSPNSNSLSSYFRYLISHRAFVIEKELNYFSPKVSKALVDSGFVLLKNHLPFASRPNTANDTKFFVNDINDIKYVLKLYSKYRKKSDYVQTSFFDP